MFEAENNIVKSVSNTDSTLDLLPIPIGHWRKMGALTSFMVVVIAHLQLLFDWFTTSIYSELHAHTVIIPMISSYLLIITHKRIDWNSKPSPLTGWILVCISASFLALLLFKDPTWSENDYISAKLVSFLGFVWGICFIFFGKNWVISVCFPLGFLLLMIPMPDYVVYYLERFLMVSSAWLSELIFNISGVPVFRNGQLLEIPGIVLEVAQECSGIRSSWILFITSILASYLFLPTLTKRFILVAFVLPLAILRNAVRVFVIGLLCVRSGPEMVDSWIHREGGPIFFAASLVPLLILANFMRNPTDATGLKG